jgi:ribosomal protein L29
MAEKLKHSELTVDDLANRLRDVTAELATARREHKLGRFKKTSEFLRLRKEIARIKTHVRQKELKV